jgi:sulfur relay (sulfurtransferase) DsrF/TusC family protein
MESSQQQTITKIQEKMEAAKLPSLVREINKETKEIKKIGEQMVVASPEKKAELEVYLNKIKDKVEMVLDNITPDKVARANLAQLAKALRTFTKEMSDVQGGKVKRSESKSLKLNINVEGMNKEDLLDFLSKKSQEKEE